MLSLMNSSQLIIFNYEEKIWEWDLHKIAGMNVPEDVVEFLLKELDRRIFFPDSNLTQFPMRHAMSCVLRLV
jgi:hypothetical protein